MNRQRITKHKLEIVASKSEFDQQLLQAQVEVQENTYKHIARELHDNVGQLLSTTKMLMGVVEIKHDHAPAVLKAANSTLGKAIKELRLLSRSLDKEWLEQFDFLENLNNEVERINAGGLIKASTMCTISISMNSEQQILLFRIVQEAIQNAIRHAQPSEVTIVIENNKSELTVLVFNNGEPLPETFHGMGTSNMRRRAQLFGGRLEWISSNKGTEVKICVPIKSN